MSITATGIGISHIGQIAINAHDLERATAFYQDKMGLKLLFKAPPGLAFFDCGAARNRENARSRFVDGFLPRLGSESNGIDE